jgi:hypothetical protein
MGAIAATKVVSVMAFPALRLALRLKKVSDRPAESE